MNCKRVFRYVFSPLLPLLLFQSRASVMIKANHSNTFKTASWNKQKRRKYKKTWPYLLPSSPKKRHYFSSMEPMKRCLKREIKKEGDHIFPLLLKKATIPLFLSHSVFFKEYGMVVANSLFICCQGPAELELPHKIICFHSTMMNNIAGFFLKKYFWE